MAGQRAVRGPSLEPSPAAGKTRRQKVAAAALDCWGAAGLEPGTQEEDGRPSSSSSSSGPALPATSTTLPTPCVPGTPPGVVAAAAVPCRMVAPVATAAAGGALAPKLVPFMPPPPPIAPVHQHQHRQHQDQHQQAGPRYVARPAVQPMMGPPVVQATAGAAAVAAPRLLVGAPVKLLMAPQLLQQQQHIQLWERVKKVGMAPGARASFALSAHAHPKAGPRAFVFGGVSDNEAKGGEDLSSEFHIDLYKFNFERRRWFAAELRPPADAKGKKAGIADAEAGKTRPQLLLPTAGKLAAMTSDKNSALYRAAVKIQASYRGYKVRKAYIATRIGGVVSELLYSPATFGLDLSSLNMPKPRARIGALMAVVDLPAVVHCLLDGGGSGEGRQRPSMRRAPDEPAVVAATATVVAAAALDCWGAAGLEPGTQEAPLGRGAVAVCDLVRDLYSTFRNFRSRMHDFLRFRQDLSAVVHCLLDCGGSGELDVRLLLKQLRCYQGLDRSPHGAAAARGGFGQAPDGASAASAAAAQHPAGHVEWERVKKVGMAPGARASFALSAHAHPKAGPRAFVFGGVSDNEVKGGEDLSSEFHNDLYTINFGRRRWFAAELRPPADAKGKKAGIADAEAGKTRPQLLLPTAGKLGAMTSDKNSALYRAAVKIQASYRGYKVRMAYIATRIGGVVSELLYSPATFGLDLSSLNMPKPRARIGALMAVVANALWLLCDIVEIGSKEVTLDDMWCLDALELDGWQLIRENTVGEEPLQRAAEDSESEWEEVSGDEDGSDDSDDSAEEREKAKMKSGRARSS
ncbi:hypothetical protein CHLRE_04g217938v5 [Chlamydomonas reinhardtii]|uniref:Uncharacterized protein n=1 Tax=Chlamydomonas reinhardtii TaxID=3055 RepID=A0A2K3DTH8_CHLRE|nr:uncharacterized protein CHLRE_04g217938v5 [Chlamydomonas reinhardtii]PNW83835.1 hypothetical protein CHLRE_04g217938v5 [Chlamydomonas reinhardtii]